MPFWCLASCNLGSFFLASSEVVGILLTVWSTLRPSLRRWRPKHNKKEWHHNWQKICTFHFLKSVTVSVYCSKTTCQRANRFPVKPWEFLFLKGFLAVLSALLQQIKTHDRDIPIDKFTHTHFPVYSLHLWITFLHIQAHTALNRVPHITSFMSQLLDL